ncbi:hypothetical protein GQ53DRAFT_817910 [Thozetella sp. PMI_491]|nr:hypothetical protein GQ53DRAFT_817910 [Thozetella sp. PMI_491]
MVHLPYSRAFIAIFFAWGAALAGAQNCKEANFTISTQQDADVLSRCGNQSLDFTRDVAISSTASGDLRITDQRSIRTITAENNTLLKTLVLDTDVNSSPPRQSALFISLQNLASLEYFTWTAESTTGNVLIRDLPAIKSINMSSLRSARRLSLENLPSLETLLVNKDGFVATDKSDPWGGLNLQDLPLGSVDNVLNHGTSGQVHLDTLRNVQHITLNSFRQGPISIYGNENLSVLFDCSACSVEKNKNNEISAEQLKLSGIAWIGRTPRSNPVRNLSFGTLWATSIVMKSEKLDLSGAHVDWVWPNKPIHNMRFTGMFDNDFFHSFVCKWSKGSVAVADSFQVNSSLGPSEFNCSMLDELRRRGILQGYYICQGNKVDVDVRSGAWRGQELTKSLSPIFSVCLALLFQFCILA